MAEGYDSQNMGRGKRRGEKEGLTKEVEDDETCPVIFIKRWTAAETT